MLGPTDRHDGTVTRVVRRAKDAERVDVWIDEAPAFDLSLELAELAGLAPGLHLSVDEQVVLIAKDHVVQAREAALRYLSDQARTAAEVRRTLGRRGFEPDVVDEVVEYVRSNGYVDDAEYARAYVRSRFSGRGHGPARLRDELLRRGVERATIEEAIDEVADPEDLADAAVRLAESRWQALGNDGDPRRRRQKTLEYLVRRGYAYEDARDAVERATTGGDQDRPGDDA